MGPRGVYREIVRPERIVQTESFDDPWYPGEALNTTVLVEEGGKTTLTITLLYDSQEIRDAVLKSPMERGVAGAIATIPMDLDPAWLPDRARAHRLALCLAWRSSTPRKAGRSPMKNSGTLQIATPTEREVVMTRVFAAPRRLVFDALTKPELLKRWYGPRGWSLVVCEIDLRVGGKTTLTSTLLLLSQEVRDTLVNSGMTNGAAETYDKVAEYLASIA